MNFRLQRKLMYIYEGMLLACNLRIIGITFGTNRVYIHCEMNSEKCQNRMYAMLFVLAQVATSVDHRRVT